MSVSCTLGFVCGDLTLCELSAFFRGSVHHISNWKLCWKVDVVMEDIPIYKYSTDALALHKSSEYYQHYNQKGCSVHKRVSLNLDSDSKPP